MKKMLLVAILVIIITAGVLYMYLEKKEKDKPSPVEPSVQTVKTLDRTDSQNIFSHADSNDEVKVNYNFTIESGKLYVGNDTKEKKVLFDTVELETMFIREECCAGHKFIIVLDKNGDAYMSDNDVVYEFSYDNTFTFTKLNANNIKGFKTKDIDGTINKLYAINNNNEEIFIK